MVENKNKAFIGILLMVAIFFIVLVVFSIYTINVFKQSSSSGLKIDKSKGTIAVVEVEGIIMKSRELVEKLLIAEKEKSIKAIIVRINSPGGAVGPVQEIYQEIQRIDQKIPVYASFGMVAASGGYYLGAATRKIFANPGTLTGSIGVVMQFMDMSKLYQYIKISPQIVKAGRYKDAGHPHRPLSDEEKNLMDAVLKDVHQQFVKDIVKKRKKKIKGNIWNLAQGQIFSGRKAKEYGLVDELMSLWEAGRHIHGELKLKDEFGLRYIKKERPFSLWDVLDKAGKVISNLKFDSWGSSPALMYKL